MPFEEKKGEWKKIDGDKSIDLGDFKVIRKPSDWTKGTEKALYTILERLEASSEVEEKAKELMEKVEKNQVEFSGNSRLAIASGIAYLALQGEINKKQLAKEGSVSITTLKKMIEMMSNTIDLN